MSFSVSVKETNIEYGGKNLNFFFCNKKNILNINFNFCVYKQERNNLNKLVKKGKTLL